MSVNKDPSGRRYVEVSVEVPGTPEDVWEAIATGRGISSWFVPTKVEERVGGEAISNFGPGMDSKAIITEWNKPHRMAAESKDDMGPNGPTVATEWIVEARSGGTCVVRVVHSWFASNDDWDAQFEQFEHGWPGFFKILKLYLTHFAGQNCVPLQLNAVATGDKSAAWAALTKPLGLADVQIGQHVDSPTGVPPIGGVVEHANEPAFPESILIKTDKPGPGISNLFAMPMGGPIYLSIRFFFYGDQAAAIAATAEPVWQEWLRKTFPPGSPVNPECCTPA